MWRKRLIIGTICTLLLLACGTSMAEETSRLIIPSRVEVIEAEAFYGDTSLKEVILPERIQRVGSLAFAGSSVKRVYLPSSLAEIADDAFQNCEGLVCWGEKGTYGEQYCMAHQISYETPETDVSFFTIQEVDDLTAIIKSYSGTFTDVYVPGEIGGKIITGIGASAFGKKNELVRVFLPGSVEIIKNGAFANCPNLTGVHTSSVKTIEANAFAGCTGLTNLDWLPSTLTWIRDSAFASCTSLKTANLPDSVTRMGQSVFSGDVELESFHYPFNWQTVDNYHDEGNIFYNCKKLTKIEIPEGVTSIANHAFAGAGYLQEVVIPDSVEVIKANAFYQCTSIKEITFPASLTTINAKAFSGCTAITDIDGLPSTLTWIKDSAFAGCTSLKTANLPDSVTRMGRSVFSGDVELESFHYPFNWQTVDNYFDDGYIFYNCKKLIRIEIPEGVTSIPNHAFAEAGYLQEVVVPDSVEVIKANAFYGCTTLKRVYLSPNVTSIAGNSFYQCSNLITWCEYGSYAYNYMVDHDIQYYYLTPDGIFIPSSAIYEGEGSLYGFARAKCSCDESVVLTEIQATIWQNGSVYRQKTVSPGITDYSMASEIHTALALYTLPLGTYRFTLTAQTPWSSETWADSTFTIIEKKPVFSFRETYGNPNFVPAEGTFRLSGEMTSNFTITDVAVLLQHNETQTNTRIDPDFKSSTTVSFQTEELNAIDYLPGTYKVYFAAKCAEVDDTWQSVHEFSLTIANGSVIDSTLRDQILAYVEDESEPWSFKEYGTQLGDYLCRMNLWDQICMAWCDFTDETRSFIGDVLTGSKLRTYQVELIKADVAELLRDMFARNDLPDASSVQPEWLKQLITYSSGVKASFEVTDAELDVLRDKWIVDWENLKILGDGAEVYKKDLKAFEDVEGFFGKVSKGLGAMGKTIKYSKAMMEAICELYTNHYRDLEMLRMMYASEMGDKEYRQAILELTSEYTSQQSAAMYRLADEVIKWTNDKAWDAAEEIVLDAVGEVATSYLSLGKLCTQVLLKVSGTTDHGENWQEFYHRFSSQKVVAAMYRQSVMDIQTAIGKNKPVTDSMIQKMQSLFIATRTATARCFDTLVKLDYQYKMRHTYSAQNVRNKEMPGVPAEAQ